MFEARTKTARWRQHHKPTCHEFFKETGEKEKDGGPRVENGDDESQRMEKTSGVVWRRFFGKMEEDLR